MFVHQVFEVPASGTSGIQHHLPQVDFLRYVHPGICLVRPLIGQEVLPPPVLPVRLDPRGPAVCGHSELPDHPEHVRGPHLVHHAHHDGHHQRRHGLHVRLHHGQDAAHSAQS